MSEGLAQRQSILLELVSLEKATAPPQVRPPLAVLAQQAGLDRRLCASLPILQLFQLVEAHLAAPQGPQCCAV